jgi:hypothetical protein
MATVRESFIVGEVAAWGLLGSLRGGLSVKGVLWDVW